MISPTLLAATVVRDFAADVPIIACAELADNVGRIQQVGADYALSVSQVAGQLLAHYILGEMVSQQTRIKLVKFAHHRRQAEWSQCDRDQPDACEQYQQI